MSNAAERRKARRSTPIPNVEAPTLEDEDTVIVHPSDENPETNQPTQVAQTVNDVILSLGTTFKTLKQMGMSEGAVNKLIETTLTYVSNRRALDLEEVKLKLREPMPWEQTPPLPDPEPEEEPEA